MAEKKPAVTSSMRVAVKAKEQEKPTAARKKPTVSSRSMSVSIGGARRTPTAKKKERIPLLMSEARVLLPFAAAMVVLFFAILFIRPRPTVSPQVSDAILVTIDAGMSATQVSARLFEAGVVDDGAALLAYIVQEGVATQLQSGSFVMHRQMEFADVVGIITRGTTSMTVTVSPAFTIKRIETLLTQRFGPEAGRFEQAVNDLVHAYRLGFGEGWLLSGTYEVNSGKAAEDLARQMYEAMLDQVRRHLGSRLLSTYSIEELLIIASLIQAETQDPLEMAAISAVIHNRLAIDEPLGIDASTRYELDDWHSPIPAIALETQSPYNTRRKKGLPPTGISVPSPQAVEAAFFPEARDDLFYLHGLDGQIHFAHTYDEHRQNIREYR
ncbi:MAG: endolytic transglycosylase MltG [Sphaerochaeta sp.]|nr:endolytic transglycosylase MltG [Sphaerochaeta sp.]